MPLDGSQTAEMILKQLEPLLKCCNDDVYVLTAVKTRTTATLYPQPGVSMGVPCEEDEQEARAYGARIVSLLEEMGASARALIGPAPAAACILETVEREDISLIAMGSHGHSTQSRFAMGSVTEKVMRATIAPLLLVRSFEFDGPKASIEQDPLSFKSALVPVDGSGLALEVVDHLAPIAKHFGSKVTVIHFVTDHAGEDDMKEADSYLETARAAFAAAGIEVDKVVERGDAAAGILDYCDAQGIDLVAMTTNGRSGPSRWMFGSVAEKVVHAGNTAMLVVRKGSAEEAAELRRERDPG